MNFILADCNSFFTYLILYENYTRLIIDCEILVLDLMIEV